MESKVSTIKNSRCVSMTDSTDWFVKLRGIIPMSSDERNGIVAINGRNMRTGRFVKGVNNTWVKFWNKASPLRKEIYKVNHNKKPLTPFNNPKDGRIPSCRFCGKHKPVLVAFDDETIGLECGNPKCVYKAENILVD